MTDRRWGLILAVAAFALYLYTLGSTLVPYRDAGEMATTVTRLGILHPPGYPLYTLWGHLFTRLPLANPAYLLNVFSAAALAAAWALLFLLGCELWGALAAGLTVALGAVSFQFWTHALVSEMYTLNVLVLVLLLWLLYHQKADLAAFVLGLGLGVRMDLVLSVPALAVLVFSRVEKEQRARLLLRSVGFGLLGASVFLYLYVRANTGPLLNWTDPSTLERLVASIIRRSYGSTLDLLSKSYAMGENFGSEFALYLKHLGRDFTLLSFPLALWGLVRLWLKNRMGFWVVAWGWLLTGPLFIYLGNLPPNPHAVAIMEASYLTPDLFYLLAIGAGLAGLSDWPKAAWPTYGLVSLLIIAQAARFYPAVNKRDNWIAADFIRNVYYSVPEPSLIVSRSDVPLFSLYYGYWVYPGFKWRVPIGQGLAGSSWYQVMMDRQVPKLQVGPVRTAGDWDALAKANPGWSLYGTLDTEWTPELHARMVPSGLVLRYLSRGSASVTASDTLLNEFGIYRGRYRYDAYYDYFSPELIEEYAKAWMEWGHLLSGSPDGAQPAMEAFQRALTFKPDMPYPAFQLAYLSFLKNDLDRADYYYHWCADNFQRMSRQADDWKSFAAVKEGLRRDQAQALAHWGVVRERLGDRSRAVGLYHRALELDPVSADARYNLAVIYWREERWKEVVEQLQAMAGAHPEDARWRVYLPRALEKLKHGG